MRYSSGERIRIGKYDIIKHLNPWVDIVVSDLLTGKIEKRLSFLSESYTRHFITILAVNMGVPTAYPATGPTATGATATANTIQDVTGSSIPNLSFNGAAADQYLGIVVGTGTTAVTISDNSLETIINHGIGAGQLSYGAVSFTDPAVSGATARYVATRTFTNNSGGSITVNESGVYANGLYSTPNSYFKYCIIRDIIAGGVAVADGKVLTVQYTIGVTA